MLEELGIPLLVVGAVVAVMVITWLVSGRESSFEQSKSVRRPVMEEEDAREKSGRKKRLPLWKKRKEELAQSEEEEKSAHPRKSILRSGKEEKAPGPGPSSSVARSGASQHVGFSLETTPVKEKAAPAKKLLMSPPTPHPSASRRLGGKALESQAPSETPPMTTPETPPMTTPESPSKMSPETPLKLTPETPLETPPKATVSSPAPAAEEARACVGEGRAGVGEGRAPSAPKGSSRKPKTKPKAETGGEALPLLRILGIVAASPLSDDDIQELVEQLLEKRNTDAEWQSARGVKTESAKTLKKLNEDLSVRCTEAESALVAHSKKIAELRGEIRQEREQRSTSEKSLQALINHQGNELGAARAKLAGLEEEVKKHKSSQQLDEEHSALQQQLAALAQHNSSLTEQLTRQDQEIKMSSETLKAELLRSQEVLQSQQDKLAEQENLVSMLSSQKQSLQATLQATSDEHTQMIEEKTKLREEVQALLQHREQQVAAVHSSSLEKMEALKAEAEARRAAEVQAVRSQLALEQQRKESVLAQEMEQLQVRVRDLEQAEQQLKEEVSVTRANGVTEGGSREALLKEKDSQLQEAQEGMEALEEERKELKQHLADMENKLEDLKTKNNTLRDSLWQARDGAAAVEKSCFEKLKQARKDSEKLCGEARAEATASVQEVHKQMLLRLLPEVPEAGGEDYSRWLDKLEAQGQEYLLAKARELTSLRAQVQGLEEEKAGSVELAEHFKTALEETMRSLVDVQTHLRTEVSGYEKNLWLKEKLLEEERTANQSLQEQLCKKTETFEVVKQQLEQSQQSLKVNTDSLEELKQDKQNMESKLKEEIEEISAKLKNLETFNQPTLSSTSSTV